MIGTPHALPRETVLSRLNASLHGLTHKEAAARLRQYGRNTLPQARPPGFTVVFMRQFASPLIYVLVAAAILSMVIQEWSDAVFISAVLIINAVIGTIQEYSAQRSASELHKLVTTISRVMREGDAYELNTEELVPGDIVLLESGDRIPADMRLLACHDLEIDESLLTGESTPVSKNADDTLREDIFLGDRNNMAFAGTLVGRGRWQGIAVLIMSGVALGKGLPFTEIMLLATALAVSAIPEGLPVALTVALAIGMRRLVSRLNPNACSLPA